MLTEAAGLAVLAALTPTALLVSAVFLGSANPRRTAILFLAGAIVMTVIMAVIIFVALRAGHLSRPHQRTPRYGVRLGLGVLLLAGGLVMARRGPRQKKPKDPAKPKKPGLVQRMIATPGPKEAFIVGLVVYSPSLTFVAAIQVIATARASIATSIGAIALVILITIVFVWLPLVLYLIRPERTGQLLERFNAWLRRNGRTLVIGAMVVAGVLLTIDGIAGLA